MIVEHTVSCNIEDCKSPVFGHHRSDKAVFSGQRNGISLGSVYLHYTRRQTLTPSIVNRMFMFIFGSLH